MRTLSANTLAAQKLNVSSPVVSATSWPDRKGWERVQATPTTDQYRCAAVFLPGTSLVQVVNAAGVIKVRVCAVNGVFDEAWTTLSTAFSVPADAPVGLAKYGSRLILAYVHEPTGTTQRVSTFASTNGGASWSVDADLHTTSSGRTIRGLGASYGGVFWADNGAASFVIGGAVWNGSAWAGIASAPTQGFACSGLGVAYNSDDGEYLCLYNLETYETVQYINSMIWDGVGWSAPVRAFHNYLEARGDLGYPAVVWDIYERVYLATYSHYDRRTETPTYRVMHSIGHKDGARWREPWPVVDLEVERESAIVFDVEHGDLFWLVSSRDVIKHRFVDSAALSSTELPLVRYVLRDDFVGLGSSAGGGAGLRGEAWFLNRKINEDQTHYDLLGRDVTIFRRYDPALGSPNVVFSLPALQVIEQHVYALGNEAALIHVKLRDRWYLVEREASVRVRWVGSTVEEILLDLVWIALGKFDVQTDGADIWSQVVPEFVLQRQESYRAALLRLMNLVSGRLRFGMGSPNMRVLFATSSDLGESVYTYGDGADAHPLQRGSYLARRLSPTIHQAYGSGGILGIDYLWDELAAGEPGMVSSLRSTIWETQGTVDAIADQLVEGAARYRNGGQLVIMPNLGQEIGDTITIQHSLYNGGEAVERRVTAIVEEYDTRKGGVFQQILELDEGRRSGLVPVEAESIDADKYRLQEMGFGSPGAAVRLRNGRLARTQTYHWVVPQTGLTDTLDYISPGGDGDLLLLRPGAGVITLPGGSNYALSTTEPFVMGDDNHAILFLYDATTELWIELARGGGVPGHAWYHTDSENGANDLLDGDHLDITYTPSNYTRSTIPAEAFDVNDLTAHLYGLDTALGGKAASSHVHATGDVTSGVLAPARGGTGVDNGTKTLTVQHSMTLAGADGRTLTIPDTGTAALATGIAGGQTINGGTEANDNLTIQGTSNATRTTSYVLLQPNGGNVGVGPILDPISRLHLSKGNWPIDSGFLSGTIPEMIVANQGANSILSVITAINAVGARSILQLRRSRGTLSIPLALQNNDLIGSISFGGYDGVSQSVFPTQIDSYVDGSVSDGSMPARISFVTGTNGSDRLERMTIKNNGRVGIGETTPTAQTHIRQPSTTAAIPVLTLNQSDVDEEFIEFTGTSTTGNATSISTSALGTYQGRLQITVNGTRRWIPFYADA